MDDTKSATSLRHKNAGIARFLSGDMVEAHADFQLALNCTPEDATLLALIANTALRLGAPNLAIRHATTALDQEPDNIDARVALAGACLQVGDFPRAREAIASLANIEQLADFRALLDIAITVEAGHFESALFDIAQILERKPKDTFAEELFTTAFRRFRSCGEDDRFAEFIHSLGVLADENGRGPVDLGPSVPEAACVDIIIPVYNSIGDLERCLASIRRCPSDALRKIILVDDCSSPESAAWLDSHAQDNSDVGLVRNAQNLGFTRTIMAGVQESTAPYMLFLNSDTEVTPGWLDGLLQAMTARPATAMVGPLSDNGFHQTIMPKAFLAQDAAREPGFLEGHPDEAAALVRVTSRNVFPRTAFLSGFCLLVRRDAFDLAGGLDCEAFPFGYWEVQDLCLKLTDLGLDSVVADHVYVHHAGGGSIAAGRKLELTRAGQARMFSRHSGLRVLVAEAVSATEPEVARHLAAWGAHEQSRTLALTQGKPHAQGGPARAADAEYECRTSPPASLSGQEVCLFVMHCPLGAPLEYTLGYLQELQRTGLVVISCLVVDNLWIPVADSILRNSDGVILRTNSGYDFGAWADLLRMFPQVWEAERVYFVNDSVIGPFGSLDRIVSEIRREDAGFFALSECTFPRHHAQSFFFGWNRKNLSSGRLKRFWDEMENFSDKVDVVHRCEVAIAPLSPDLPDPGQHFLFGFGKIFGCAAADLSLVNPTHHAWKYLLAAGFPFLKTDLLRDGVAGIDTSGWEKAAGDHGADPDRVLRHIEGSRLNRLAFARRDPPAG